eukprot:sb/3470619/
MSNFSRHIPVSLLDNGLHSGVAKSGESRFLRANFLWGWGLVTPQNIPACSVLLKPLTMQVRLQTTSGYKGFSDCLRKTLAKEGARGLYKGMMAPMASTSAMNAVFFGVYSSVLQSLDNDMDRPKVSSTYIAGTVSGLLAGFISGPVELIKCRLQVSAGNRHLSNKDEPTETSKQPIRTRYLGHVTIRDQYNFLIRSVPAIC